MVCSGKMKQFSAPSAAILSCCHSVIELHCVPVIPVQDSETQCTVLCLSIVLCEPVCDCSMGDANVDACLLGMTWSHEEDSIDHTSCIIRWQRHALTCCLEGVEDLAC